MFGGLVSSEVVDVNVQTPTMVLLGSQFSASALAVTENGDEFDATGQVSFESTDPAIIGVLGQGQLQALALGEAFVRVVIDGVADGVLVEVVTTLTVPAVPSGLGSSNPQLTSLDVSWNSVVDADWYEVYRDLSGGGTFSTLVYSGVPTSFTDGGLISGTTYYYKVLAANGAGSSALSAAVFATTSGDPPPPIPTGLVTANPGFNTIDVYWDAATGATGYEVYRDTDSAGAFSMMVYDGPSLSITAASLLADTTYYFKVLAKNASASSALSGWASGQTNGPPPTPTGLAIIGTTSTSIDLSWDAAPDATNYELYRDTTPGGAFTTLVYSGTATSAMDAMGITMGTGFYYRVLATNAGGASALSTEAWGRAYFNGGFENGAGLGGWITQDVTTQWYALQAQSGGNTPSNPPNLPDETVVAREGAWVAIHGWDGDIGVITMQQDLDIGPDTQLVFQYHAGWDITFGGPTLDREFTVRIQPAGGGADLQADLILTAGANTNVPSLGWTGGVVDVTAYANTRVRVVFEWSVPEVGTGPAQFQLDDVRLQ